MQRLYETIIVFDSYQQEDRLNSSLESLEKFITENGGKVIAKNRWGKRRLAYEIRKKQHGLYICLTLETDNPQLIKDLEQQYRLRDEVLRYLTIKMDKKMLQHRSPRGMNAGVEQEDRPKPVQKETPPPQEPPEKTEAQEAANE